MTVEQNVQIFVLSIKQRLAEKAGEQPAFSFEQDDRTEFEKMWGTTENNGGTTKWQ